MNVLAVGISLFQAHPLCHTGVSECWICSVKTQASLVLLLRGLSLSQARNLRKDLFFHLSLVQIKHWRQPHGCAFPLATNEDVSQSEWRLFKMILQLCEFWLDLLNLSHRPFLVGLLLYNMPEKISINHCWGEEIGRDFHVCSWILMMSGATHSYSAWGSCLFYTWIKCIGDCLNICRTF